MVLEVMRASLEGGDGGGGCDVSGFQELFETTNQLNARHFNILISRIKNDFK